MWLLLFAQKPTDGWFKFASDWGDTVTIAGFFVTIVGFAYTWRRQATIKEETRAAISKIGLMVLHDSLHQLLWQAKMTLEMCQTAMWLRSRDFCLSARETVVRLLVNPHLTTEEKTALRVHRDNLTQVKDYIETQKLRGNPPASFHRPKKEALDECITFLLSVQARLQQIVLEP